MAEILLGKKVQSFSLDGFEATLFAHNKCTEVVKKLSQGADGNWKELPDGPLRKAFAAANKEKVHEALRN